MRFTTRMVPIRPLEWKRADGDAAGDSLQEAQEAPGHPGSDVWQIAIHDGGPTWNWFRCSAGGEVTDVGTGGSPDECKRQIANLRAVGDFPVNERGPLSLPDKVLLASLAAVAIVLVTLAIW